MKNLKEILKELESLKEFENVIPIFEEGITDLSIFDRLQKFGLTANEDLKTLYTWKNGGKLWYSDIELNELKTEGLISESEYLKRKTNNLSYIHSNLLFGDSFFLPLDYAIHSHLDFNETSYPELFVFFASDGQLLINLDPNSKFYSRIYYKNASIPIPEPVSIFLNLEDMFNTFLHFFKQKIFFLEKDMNNNYDFARDYNRYSFEGLKLNSKCQYWNMMVNNNLDYEYENKKRP